MERQDVISSAHLCVFKHKYSMTSKTCQGEFHHSNTTVSIYMVTDISRSRQATNCGNMRKILRGQVRITICYGQNVPKMGFCKFAEYSEASNGATLPPVVAKVPGDHL